MTRITTWLALALAGLIGASLYFNRLGSPPASQPAAVRLDSIDAFRADFNHAADTTRVVLVLSPTCPFCLKGTRVAQDVLERHAGKAITVFVVWLPILPTDWGEPGSSVMSRMPDARVRQYWDKNHLVADAIRAAGEARRQYPECCYEGDVWWDLMAVYRPGPRWEDLLPEAALVNGTIEDAAPQLDALLLGDH